MKIGNLTDTIEKEIFTSTSDLSMDYAELALDTLTKESLLSEVPVVKSLIAFYKVTSSIIDRHNVKKILMFLEQFHANKINDKKLNEFKERFDQNPKHRTRVLETILLLNEKFIDEEKSKILANLFSAHIEEKLTWEEFLKLSFILSNLNPWSYKFLERIVDKESSLKFKTFEMIEGEAFLLASGIGSTFEDRYRMNNTGKKLYEFGFKPLLVSKKD